MSRTSFSRRRLLRSATALPFGWMFATANAAETPAPPACVLSPEMTEGPFFVDERLQRADLIGTDVGPGLRNALPLALTLTFVNVRQRCTPLRDLQVDVWHTDALGNYSDVQDQRGRTFCRGYQVTDGNGRVTFNTIYPGWYPGRAIHIHVKARRFDANGRQATDFTSQVFFDEATNDAVMAMPPYNRRSGRRTTNARDGIYGNARSLLVKTSSREDKRGLSGEVVLGLELA